MPDPDDVARREERSRESNGPWWREGVLYEIYVRSFADSNDDGIGDLEGIARRMDHLAWLGIDGIWLTPVTRSPDRDWGYDVSDYRSVQPQFGDLDGFDRVVREAEARGIHVILDLVPNHTSDRHPWFVDARSSRSSRHRDWYVWADPRPDGSPPNNWISVFGGPTWTLDRRTGQYYLHNFLPEQPDLNWWNEEVREAFDDILRLWFDRGVAGFRIDVAHAIVKDEALRDNLPVTEDDHPRVRALGQRQVYNMHRPEVHEVFRRWRRIADAYERPRILIGETWVLEAPELVRYYGTGDQLHLAFNFALVLADFDPKELRQVVESMEEALPEEAWPAWTGSNHDVGRFPARWCGEDRARAGCALMMLLTLRGTPFLYYGDEIGMADVEVPPELLQDPVGKRHWPDNPGRDPARTPMQWSPAEGAGFTAPGITPWLPIGDAGERNVEDQRRDRGSMLHLCRDLIALRRSLPDLRSGRYEPADSPPGAWAWRRGRSTMVALNLSDEPASVLLPGEAAVLIGTRRERDGERVPGEVRLGAWEGVVLDIGG